MEVRVAAEILERKEGERNLLQRKRENNKDCLEKRGRIELGVWGKREGRILGAGLGQILHTEDDSPLAL